ncbi:Rne/Rng family ribonuclease [Corynebacterium alimapuense]|uniref:Rne/Rng family ribonuclease n=1 Tax=Corynebacterium alimapuense TaxID=1576874 RepID=UPI003CCC55E5
MQEPAVDVVAQDAVAVAFPDFDRTAIGERARVHVLAKALGLTSRQLIVALEKMGLKKVAQSALNGSEIDALLTALATPQQLEEAKPVEAELPVTPAAPASPVEPEEKIRTRVRKNVVNEISQIEEKVEADLAAVLSEEPLQEVLPEITPMPKASPDAEVKKYTPIFRAPEAEISTPAPATDQESEDGETASSRRRRRGRRGASRGRGVDETPVEGTRTEQAPVEPAPVAETTVGEQDVDKQIDQDLPVEPVALKGSTRLEAQRRRRTELREEGKKRKHIVSQAEFLARRESVARTMVVRERNRNDHPGTVTQVGVLEDDLLVEHFVTSEAQASMIGNIYLGRVQNVLPSMEAAFIDIGEGRNGVLYAGEVDWKSAGLGGRGRRIEQALKSGDQVLVQVSKDPVGHKGARLTTQISLAGRYLVYVPGGRSAGISRKLPGPERKRLKEILTKVVPGQGGAIIRTAAENVSEEAIGADVERLHTMWEDIRTRANKEMHSKGSRPVTMYEEPNMLVKVIRDLFNEDFTRLIVDGDHAWNTVHAYVKSVAPDLLDRVQRFNRGADEQDAFAKYRVDEQLQKALARKVWLPSGGTLVIDRTEAMTVVDVNTGKFTGSGGNLEETVTRNNLEAAEEIVRQMRLRDLGGMIVVDFIDMVLSENQELVLRRLKEALGRDRTRHQVSEVTSLGLVQMTRKRLGTGLLETFATECEHCAGRGLIVHEDPVEENLDAGEGHSRRDSAERGSRRRPTPIKAAAKLPPTSETKASDLEKLAAAVVVAEDEAAAEETVKEHPQQGQSRRRRSRRGRRNDTRDRRNSGENKPDQAPAPTSVEPEESDLEKIVSEALRRAGQADPEEPTGADYAPAEETPEEASDLALATGEKTFQQAVSDFEKSPRRRRRTRGNSRSDHRPQPQEHKKSAPSESKAQPVEVARETPVAAEIPTGRKKQQRRRKTRSVSTRRSTPVSDDLSVAPAAAPVTPAPAAAQAPKVASSSEVSRKGRRRAVRRTMIKPEVAQQHAASNSQPTSAEKVESSAGRHKDLTVARRGGRRRVTRRTTQR